MSMSNNPNQPTSAKAKASQPLAVFSAQTGAPLNSPGGEASVTTTTLSGANEGSSIGTYCTPAGKLQEVSVTDTSLGQVSSGEPGQGTSTTGLEVELDLSGAKQVVNLAGTGTGAEMSLADLHKLLSENVSLLGQPDVTSELARLAGDEANVSLIYSMLTDILCKAQRLTLDKTPVSYRIVTNLVRLVLLPHQNQNQNHLAATSGNFLRSMLKALTNAAYRNSLVALSPNQIVTDYWRGEYFRLTQSPGGYGVVSNITGYLKTLLIPASPHQRQRQARPENRSKHKHNAEQSN